MYKCPVQWACNDNELMCVAIWFNTNATTLFYIFFLNGRIPQHSNPHINFFAEFPYPRTRLVLRRSPMYRVSTMYPHS